MNEENQPNEMKTEPEVNTPETQPTTEPAAAEPVTTSTEADQGKTLVVYAVIAIVVFVLIWYFVLR